MDTTDVDTAASPATDGPAHDTPAHDTPAHDTPAAGAVRTRTYSWDDPRVHAEAARTMDGLSFLQAVLAGDLPPTAIGQTVGFEPESVEAGRVVFALTPAEHHYNPIGSVHGGVYATLLDSACGCAVQSTLPLGVGYTSLDLSVKFLRPIAVETGRVLCTGEVVNAGRRTALAHARIHDGAGRLLAEASSTCLIIRP